ncbi:MAG: NifB/NifX family molybdenum-iron cluster-binding protein [Candidatus Hydrogenedentes bacterium]|nr:NifB/NifX family molybdenum-iron cluster-binding protein [Candidatus Hydrogenedentota bacterium]
MKIAFTVSGDTLEAPLDSRFGRAPKFLVYDLDNASFEIVDNEQNLNAAQGAGIQSAQKVVETGSTAVVTGHCGPNAFRALNAASVKIYTSEASTVAEALALYRDGKLSEAGGSDVEGHWV